MKMQVEMWMVAVMAFYGLGMLILGISSLMTALYRSRTIDALLARMKRIENRLADDGR